ncbi:MFS transporter [Phormidium yuhuli AB48]|uniref:MFS transporter n=1 Tax=Phormidium yuhuli AB48 TaxID=2940671 RepID=A0ABY5AML9_9CYAN|nr:MFS transporter [Phormidium yuhuli]USR90181.1 MFS transporter [Phormidium yuhuli AB48]
MTDWVRKFSRETLRVPVILGAGSLTTMAGGAIAPVLPDLMQELNIDLAWGGTLASFHCLTLALSSPLLGLLADKIGPSRVLFPAMTFYGIFGVVGAWMPNFWSLLVVRGLLGIACGGLAASCLGVLGRLYEGEERTRMLGFATAVLTITGIVYPLLGGLVGNNDWQYAFYLNGIAFPLGLLGLYAFNTSSSFSSKSSPSQGLGGKLTRELSRLVTARLLVTMGLSSIAMYAVVIYAPIYLDQALGLTPKLNGMVLASRAIGAAFISAFGAKPLAKMIGLNQSTALGFGIMAATLAPIPWITELWGVLLAAALFGLGFGIVLPNLYNALANLSPFELRASILAVGTGISFLGQFASPVLLGVVLNIWDLATVFYAASILTILAGLLLFAPLPQSQS